MASTYVAEAAEQAKALRARPTATFPTQEALLIEVTELDLIVAPVQGLVAGLLRPASSLRCREHGWTFEPVPGATGDTLHGHRYLHELYARALPHYTGRVTVPVLWDQERRTIVNNESSEIIRMLNSAFDGIGAAPGDYYPAALRAEIDQVNERVYTTVNNGVYRAGFATTQAAYDEAVTELFATLDWLEERLARQRYLDGRPDHRGRLAPVHLARCASTRSITATSSATCAGWSTTRNLWAYTRELYQWPGVAETVDFAHIKGHYYASHATINPTGIVPRGPLLDFAVPHGRDALPAVA